ncbi:MAG: hypothetical protein Q8Q12_16450 [bacterium]|nr:hypothetical protein [bacterium]
MYVSRLAFHSLPGRANEVEQALRELHDMVIATGGSTPRILRTHFASSGAPDVVFEHENPDLANLENHLRQVNENPYFQEWRRQISTLLWQAPKREIYIIVE